MTIREFICKHEAEGAQEHLDRLIELGAPQIILDGWKKAVAALKDGKVECGGDSGLLNVEVVDFIKRKGNGGKPWVQFNGFINYFPQAKYGRFIARDVSVKNLHKLNANELRAYAVSLGADKKTLYGTSKEALRLIVQRLEKGGER